MTDRPEYREAQHPSPVWKERSNFIIAAEIASEGTSAISEQLSARQISETEFELCCIPFFLYDVALGDIVETSHDYMLQSVVVPSGRYVFRIWFGDKASCRDEVASALLDMGALLEWSSANLLAVDARDAAHGQEIANFLATREHHGGLIYETGKS